MTRYHAALPMYDMPETADQTDAHWAAIRAGLPEGLLVDFDRPKSEKAIMDVLHHPRLLLSQTCWGPIHCGLLPEMHILAQPDYSDVAGGDGPLYRAAIVVAGTGAVHPVPEGHGSDLPVDRLKGATFAYNDRASLSGYLAVSQDMTEVTGHKGAFYGRAVHSGAHRKSVQMVAGGEAEVAAVDCRTLAMLRKFDPAAKQVDVIGWTAARPGLPFVCSPAIDDALKAQVSDRLIELGAHPA